MEYTSTQAARDGSRTVTATEADEIASQAGPSSTVGALRLRGAPSKTRQSVAWGEDVVDNEGAGKKSSKICCIYHAPRQFDESSDEESSDSDSDASCDDARSNPNGAQPHRHVHHAPESRPRAVIHDLKDYEPNAYEIDPAKKSKGKRKADKQLK